LGIRKHFKRFYSHSKQTQTEEIILRKFQSLYTIAKKLNKVNITFFDQIGLKAEPDLPSISEPLVEAQKRSIAT